MADDVLEIIKRIQEGDDLIARIEKAREKRIEESVDRLARLEHEALKKRAKPLHELVVSQIFDINEVLVEQYANSITPYSEIVVGGFTPSYDTGFTARTRLLVQPQDSSVPTQLVYFNGFSALRKGDSAIIRIPCYEEVGIGEYDFFKGKRQERKVYVSRALKEEELAIELSLLSGGRIERSADYSKFIQ